MRAASLCLFGIVLVCLCYLLIPPPHEVGAANQPVEKPRLVVMLVFDQMRGDYLTRWQDLFVEGGFRRLLTEGAWFQNCHYPYAGTMTGPGHATISTGCSPHRHGIIGNEWYDRNAAKIVNCVGSDRHEQIPLPRPDKDGKVSKKGVSPQRMLAPTLADAIKEQLGDHSRVVCLSLKDRSSTLPGGKTPDACYWADADGRFVTSTYHRDRLHGWVTEMNRSGLADHWHGKEWARLRPDLDYARYSGPDDVKGEGKGKDQGRTFPHPTNDGAKKERTNYYAALANSPFGNDLLLELTKRAIEAERLGLGEKPDFLSVSFSSNDLVGHTWGPDSQEVLDVTLRTDLMVRDLLNYLDSRVGKGRYLIAFTADHGICPLPEVSRTKGIAARRIDPKPLQDRIEDTLNTAYPGPKSDKQDKGKWVLSSRSNMIYLDHKRAKRHGARVEEVSRTLARWLEKQPGISRCFTRDEVRREPTDAIHRAVQRSFHPDRSGDVMMVVAPHVLLASELTGTTHGTPYAYDTHVPLVAMGPGVARGIRKERVSPELMPVILARGMGIAPPAEARTPIPAGLFGR